MTDAERARATIREWETMTAEQAAAMDPEGDFAKRWLLNGVLFDLLGDVKGVSVLDAGSGQGSLSRLLARRGALVTSLEPAEPLYNHSVRMEALLHQGIELLRADLTTHRFDRHFDAVVANMVFVSIRDWELALESCALALRPGGRLVFSIDHPMVSAAHDEWREDGFLRISDYASPRPVDRPVATDFHRPLSDYVNALSRHGLRLESMAEPTLTREATLDPAAPPHAELLRAIPNFAAISALKG